MNNPTNKLIPELRFPEFVNDGEWKETIIGNIFESFSGGTPNTSEKEYYNGDIPFIRSAEINREKTELFLTDSGLKNSSAKIVEKGDLLVALYGANSGDSAISKIKGAINQAILCLKSEFSNSFTQYYLTLKKEWIVTKFVQGGQGNLSGDIVKSIPIPLSKNPKEQKKIADCLYSLDDVITTQSNKLETLKIYKKGLMQNLFPQEGEKALKLRFKEFEKDAEWKEETLGKICDVRDGTHDSPKYVSNGYPMITSKNLLSNGMIDFENVSFLTEEDYIQINKRSKVDINDILFGMIGTIGNPVIVKTDGFAIKNVALIKSIGKLNQEFLLHQLKSDFILNQFEKVNAGGILKFIALGVIRNLTVIVPSPKEQQKIADTLSSLDEIIKEQSNKIDQLKSHKKALMQGLFPKINK